LWRDLGQAVRGLRRSPGFATLATLVLALGVGTTSTMFALVDAALVRPLPFVDPARLMMIWERPPSGAHNRVAPLNYLDWSEQNQTFSAIAAVAGGSRTMTGTDGVAERIPGQAVTARFFDVLGIMPVAGRTFVASDDTTRSQVVVLSERLWRSRFGSDPSLIGRRITLDGLPYTVIGIVPARFEIMFESQLWTLFVPVRSPEQRRMHYLQVVGRLKDGVSLERAQADMTGLAARVAQIAPETNKGWGVSVEPLRQAIVSEDLRATSLMLGGVVLFVLLMACANVANLLVTRGVGRQRELAVRTAMGASPRRIATQLVVETIMLAALGGLVGGTVAAAVLRAAPTVVPAGLLPASVALSVDLRMVVLATVIVLVVALACGLAPARFAARAALTPALEGDGRVMGSGGRLRATMAVAQVASAIVLLCGAALLLRSFLALEERDPGFRAGNILTATVNLPFPFGGTRRYETDAALRQYYDGVEREVRSIPGVHRVAWGSAMPLDGFWSGTPFEVEGDPPRPAANRDIVDYHPVSASYFSTLGVTILQGRDFTPADTAAAAPVCIVNEAFVRRYLRGRNPIGMRLHVQQQTIASPGVAAREIVGVARQVRARPNETVPVPQVYVPLPQNPWFQATLIVRSATPAPETLLPAIRAAAARIDPDQALTQVRTLDTIASEATARWRFRAQLVGAFAALALTLAIVGVFGLLAYSVQQRRREFGLRLAIGARGTDIAGLVLGGTARVATAGMAIGMLAAAVLSRGMASLLFGVTPFDAVSFSSSAVVLAVTAMLAAIGPVRRAMRINPAALLRGDS